MRVFISVDMEGISGVVAWPQTNPGQFDYDRMRKLMTEEANAAIEGALQAGATEVLVNDSHDGMRNLMLEDLNPDARLITGDHKPMSMMEGVGPGFDAVFLIGYHSQASSTGVLNHTYTTRVVHYSVNGKVVGETGMNAYIAGFHGVPVVLVSGDSIVAAEAKDLLGNVEAVAVKEPRSQFSATCLHPTKARALIKEAAVKALSSLSNYRPLTPPTPATVRLMFNASGHADSAAIMPGSVRVDPLTVEFTAPEYLTAYRGARTMMHLT